MIGQTEVPYYPQHERPPAPAQLTVILGAAGRFISAGFIPDGHLETKRIPAPPANTAPPRRGLVPKTISDIFLCGLPISYHVTDDGTDLESSVAPRIVAVYVFARI